MNLLAPLLRTIRAAAARLGVRRLDDHATGMALAKKKYAGLCVFYCPLDFSWAVRAAMRRIRPDVLVLAELELWPNLVRAARRKRRPRGGDQRPAERAELRRLSADPAAGGGMLRRIDLLAVQDDAYAERFRDLGAGPESVHVTGSMKYDGAQTDRRQSGHAAAGRAGRLRRRGRRLPGRQHPGAGGSRRRWSVFRRIAARVAASCGWCWSPAIRSGFESVGRLLDASGMAWQRRTRLWTSIANRNSAARPRACLVDVVGELGAWWGTAQIAFVGGSLGNRGGQNMIEPAAYGAAVSFGPNTRNFRDIVAAMLAHAGGRGRGRRRPN